MTNPLLLTPVKTCIALTLLLFSFQLAAQDISVTIKVTNPKKEPIAFASVMVSNRLDSSQTIKKMADSSGVAVFNLAKNVQYTVKISSFNYLPV